MVNIEIGFPDGSRKTATVAKLSEAFFEALNMLLRTDRVPLAIHNDGREVWTLAEEPDDPAQARINLAKHYGNCVRLEKLHGRKKPAPLG